MATIELDVRHFLCPMPVIKAQQKSRELIDSDVLKIIATDPGTLHDIPSWSRMNGHKVLDTQKVGHEIHITIQIIKDRG